MTPIKVQQLNGDEFYELKFAISVLVANKLIDLEQEEFIYANLYRDDEGIAYAYTDLVDREKLSPIL